MNCREFVASLDAHLDGTMPAARAAAFQAHLAGCRNCASYLEGYRRTVDACRELATKDGAQPPALPEDLVRAILAGRPGS